ncbi:MAG: NAD(P)/FAD-dependent oxidoreductase [Lachnospiraceae bacterium]
MSELNKVIIIGAGAAGLMAAALASEYGKEITVIEKNEKPGKKLYITGKGRCNLTNACDRDEFMSNIVSNNRFMYSSFNAFNNYDVMDYFERIGVPLKTERGMRVFPESDKSSDIINALEKECLKNGVNFLYRTKVSALVYDDNEKKAVKGVKLQSGQVIPAGQVIVATGGLSYASTGSTGDGYRFAESAGHDIVKCTPSLVSLRIKEKFCADMAGLSLKNVRVAVKKNDRELYSGFGEMLFTHTGVSGPLILTCTAVAGDSCDGAELSIDLKPALETEKLDERLTRDLTADSHKQLKSIIRGLLPASMVPVFVKKAGVDDSISASCVTREDRRKIINTMKSFTMTISGLGGYSEAVITKGGVEVKQIKPSTMESKLCEGLYFAGEVLDVDALTGGFNLQVAWSTAAAAARAVSEK